LSAVLALVALPLAAPSARAETPVIAVWRFGSPGGPHERLWIRADGRVDLASDSEQGGSNASGRLSPAQLARFAAVLRESDLCRLPSSSDTAVAGQGYLAVRMARDLACVTRLTTLKWKHAPGAAKVREAIDQVIASACPGGCRNRSSAQLSKPPAPEPATREAPPVISLREHVTGVDVAWCAIDATGKVTFSSVFDDASRAGQAIEPRALSALIAAVRDALPALEQVARRQKPSNARARYLSLWLDGSSSTGRYDLPFARLRDTGRARAVITRLRTMLSRASGGTCLFEEVLRVPAAGAR
jgi:hypothetical protein